MWLFEGNNQLTNKTYFQPDFSTRQNVNMRRGTSSLPCSTTLDLNVIMCTVVVQVPTHSARHFRNLLPGGHISSSKLH